MKGNIEKSQCQRRSNRKKTVATYSLSRSPRDDNPWGGSLILTYMEVVMGDPMKETQKDLTDIIANPSTPDDVREEAEERIKKYDDPDDDK